MLRCVGGRLVWREGDVERMARVVGDEDAARMQCPVHPAIIRAAERAGVRVHSGAAMLVEAHWQRVRRARVLHDASDAPALTASEQRCMPQQRAALRFFAAAQCAGFLVADEVGVGKTLPAILWARHTLRATRTAIITTNGAKDQWADVIRHYLGRQEQITIVDGTIPEQIAAAATRSGWVIGHWESLVHADAGWRKHTWNCVIADEAHYANNRDSQRSLRLTALGKRAQYRMAMTANPYTNDPSELWAVLRFLYPQTYTSFWRWFYLHVKGTPRPFGGFTIEGPRRPKLLQWELAPFTLRRTRAQVYPHLPPITRERRTARLTARGLREYDRLRKQVFAELDSLDGGTKVLPIINDLSRLTRVRQYLIDPGLIGARESSLKYPLIYELLEARTGPLVVFTQYREAALRCAAWLRQQRRMQVRHINGHVSLRDRTKAKQAFLAGQVDALLVVMQAGREALNLGKYGRVAFLDLPWNPRDLEQCEGRVDRPEEHTGKQVPTTAYRCVIRNTYEERMEDRLVRKHTNFNAVFTVNQLKELFA